MFQCSMRYGLASLAVRFRLITGRLLARLGLGEDAFLILLAVVVGVVTAAAAVSFHELIEWVRDLCYGHARDHLNLYQSNLWLLLVIPASGGLIVGILARYTYRGLGPSSIVDVMESVGRPGGGIKARTAVERIVASAVTIGTGGSAGAEGPIVTIGAAIANTIGRIFSIAGQHMPVLTGCGTAAGISAIFNSPLGGVLFTLEVILRDFSVRTFAPVVLASVIANVTTKEIFAQIDPASPYTSIFRIPSMTGVDQSNLSWTSLPNFLLLGLCCGAVGVTLTRLMFFAERRFARLRVSPIVKPAIGGLILGTMGTFYIMVFGWFLNDGNKPIPFNTYPMPGFFGDGYGVVQQMLTGEFFGHFSPGILGSLLVFLLIAKILGTCATLGSGGSGGIIAPSLFLGAVTGGLLGIGLQRLGYFTDVPPQIYALVGMGAVLAAVVHAPLAAILIVLDVTRDPKLMLPAMLATIVATALARLLFRDSIYTFALRERGVRIGAVGDLAVLRRLSVEQTDLEPANFVNTTDPFQRVLDLTSESGTPSFVVLDRNGRYSGMIVLDDIKTALIQREAVPLLLVHELMRPDVPLVKNTDDLAHVIELFARFDVSHLPVSVGGAPDRVIGLVSRTSLMRRYQRGLAQTE